MKNDFRIWDTDTHIHPTHPECKFPESPDHALGWKSLSPTQMRKMMWDNAVRFYGEP